LLFDLGEKSYELKWQNFADYSSKGTQLVTENVKPAIPAVIKSGEGISHETHFAPRTFHVATESDAARFKNFLAWNTFVSEIEKVKKLDVRIVSEFYGLEDKEARVYVEITPAIIYSLKTYGWAAPSAWPQELPASVACQTSVSPAQRQSSQTPNPSPAVTSPVK
jgi:hypothetical protein